MSGEFGRYESGYLHDQVKWAAEDLATGDYGITRAWAGVFEAFAPIAKAICWAEARDSDQAEAIMETIVRFPDVAKAIADVERYIAPFREVQRRSIAAVVKGDER